MSAQITRHTPDFATAAQVKVEDIEEIAALGFKTLINNRPDGESPDQPSSAQLEDAAQKFGLHYIYQPIVRSQVAAEAATFASHMAVAPKPVLAFCRSGTRSTMLFQTANTLKTSK
jgi:uncharacterized protein (TIGR01244 family)